MNGLTAKPLKLDAQQLVSKIHKRRLLLHEMYAHELQKCFHMIATTEEHNNTTFINYTVPVSIEYDFMECIKYMKKELRKAHFYVKRVLPGNVLFVSWDPFYVGHSASQNDNVHLQQQQGTVESIKVPAKSPTTRNETPSSSRQPGEAPSNGRLPINSRTPSSPITISYNPKSAISNLTLRSQLMQRNEKYSHLKSIQNKKK